MQVVDRDQHGTRGGGRGDERHRPRSDEEAVLCRVGRTPAQCALERRSLAGGHLGERRSQRRQHLEQRGVVELRLRLDAPGSQLTEPACVPAQVIQQPRLADAGLAEDDDRTTATVCRVGQEGR